MAILEYRYVGANRLVLDSGAIVDSGGFTGPIDNTLAIASAQITAGNLVLVPNGTYAQVYGNNPPRTAINNSYAESDVSQAFSITGLNGAATLPVPPGFTTVSFDLSGGTLTVAFEVSVDGGANFRALAAARVDGATAPAASTANPTGQQWEAAIPAGATHVRARISAFTSGTLAVRIGLSDAQYEPAVSIAGGAVAISGNPILGPGVADIGFFHAAGIETDDTGTPLGVSGVFTGPTKDITAMAAGSAFATTNSRPQELRFSASSDVAGTLYLEVSVDNVTWRRIKAVPLAQADGTSVFYGEIIHRPSRRYARAVFINGAGAQTHFNLTNLMLGN